MLPFCDAFRVSVAFDDRDALVASTQPILDLAGFAGEWSDERVDIQRCPGDGVVRGQKISSVYVLSTTGVACARLRDVGCWHDYLSAMAVLPHRVTGVHATLDQAFDAPPIVWETFQRAKRGEVAFTRKRAAVKSPELHWGPGQLGVDTGSVYLGTRQAEVRVVVYDKREERLKVGVADPGPCLRIEVRLKSKVGATLRDVFDPTVLFYHFAAPDLVVRPAGTPDWESHALGFALAPRREFLPAELLARKLESSADVRRLLDLAQQCGPRGLELLFSRMRSLAGQSLPTGMSGPQGGAGGLPMGVVGGQPLGRCQGAVPGPGAARPEAH